MKRAYIPAFLWLCLVTGLSVMPNVRLPNFNLFSIDKLGHAGAYGVLCFLLLQVQNKKHPGKSFWEKALFPLFFSVCYGCAMEFVQYAFLPGRFFEIDDMAANTAGALAALGVAAMKPSKF